MPRPSRDRQTVTVYLARTGLAQIDELAAKHTLTRSDIIRLALKHGLPAAARDLERGKSPQSA